jgi:hypothetical protein
MIISIKNEIAKPLWAIFQDRGYFFRRKDLLKSKHRGLAISFFIDIIILLLILSGPVALLLYKSLPSNYRPVSLLSCVSKIFEKSVFKNIFNHLHKNKLLYKFKSGFIPGLSTTHQLLEIYHTILTWAIFQDRGYFFRRKDLLKSKHRGLAISFFIDIIILLLIIAHVIPLFKNGDKSLPSNYRPVSLLSCVSKIFEKIVFKNIFNHLHKNKLRQCHLWILKITEDRGLTLGKHQLLDHLTQIMLLW